MNLKKFFLMAPAGDDGAATGGGAADPDRGDNFAPDTHDAHDTHAPDRGADAGKSAAQTGSEPAEDEDEGEGKSAAEGEGGGKPRTGKGVIPLARHESILAREREQREALARELRRYQGGERAAQVNDALNSIDRRLAPLEEEYAKLITDGEHAKATAKMREIRALERERGQRESDMRIAEATARAAESARFEITRERLEVAYPEINPDHVEYDAAQSELIVDLMQVYQLKNGMTPTEAMQKAVVKVLGVEGSRQAAATTVKPRVAASEVDRQARQATPEKDGKDPGGQRRQAALDKALDTARRQPADIARVGADSDKAGKSTLPQDVMKMSYADFARLDDAELARLRGDEVTA